MTEVSSTVKTADSEEGAAFPVGSWERPDAAGVVRRGEAAEHVRFAAEQGHTLRCSVGRRGEEDRCDRAATMEIYGLTMCPAHGEEAASGALEEIAFDLENELQRPINDHLRPLSPHLRHALMQGLKNLPGGIGLSYRAEEELLAAFPLRRERACTETVAYTEEADGPRLGDLPPFEAFMMERLFVHRLMRLAFEEGATWMVEVLEAERENVAAQAAYALALEREAGFRRRPGDEEKEADNG